MSALGRVDSRPRPARPLSGVDRTYAEGAATNANDPLAVVSGLSCWATLFHLFPYERIDAHLAVAGKWGRLCYIDEPVSLFFDVSDYRRSSP